VKIKSVIYWNIICVTDDHEYVTFVVVAIQTAFPLS